MCSLCWPTASAECAPGYGSHVLLQGSSRRSSNQRYPVTAPACQYRTQSSLASTDGSSSGTTDACRCFKCPVGYTTRGGPLDIAACLPTKIAGTAAASLDSSSVPAAAQIDSKSPSEQFAAMFKRTLLQTKPVTKPKRFFIQVAMNTLPPNSTAAQAMCKNTKFKTDAATALAAGVMQMGSFTKATGTTVNCWARGTRVSWPHRATSAPLYWFAQGYSSNMG